MPARSNLLLPQEVSGRSLFVYGNPGYTNPFSGVSYLDIAVCGYAPNYSSNSVQTSLPQAGSEADVNFIKICDLFFKSLNRTCAASKLSYQAQMISLSRWVSGHNNWTMSWSQKTQSWFLIRADGIVGKEWINGKWATASLARVKTAGIKNGCNNWVWKGDTDKLRCICSLT